MPLVLANRVQESGTANTTVSFTLTGAVAGFQSFAAIGNTNTTYYAATDGAGNWEVGLGTYSTTGPTLTRTTVYASSNAGSAVTFSGAVNVFVTYPSGRSVNLNESGNVSALGTVSSGTWQGSTVGVAYGGTGVTASSGANSVVLRDANQNISINRLNQGLQTITASGGTTILTVASQFNQALVGTGGHTFQLPDATTLSATTAFQFNNNATGTLTITNNAGATVGTISAGGAAGIALLSNATVAGTWDVHAYIPENVTWGTNALALGSTVISGGTWQGGTVQPAYGGTGLTTFVGANNALYSTGAATLTAGTLPVAAGGTGRTSYTINGVLYASGTGTLTNGSALTFSGSNLSVAGSFTSSNSGNENVYLSDGSVVSTLQNGSNSLYFNVNTNSATNGNFIWRNTSSYSEQMRLTSTGLGIGTSSPGQKLSVNGDALIGTNLFISNGAGSMVGATSPSLYSPASATLGISAGGVERMRLDSSGNLGLGVTPSAWDTFRVLQIGALGSIGFDGGSSFEQFSNVYYGTGAYRYISSSASARPTRYAQGNGQHIWFNAAAGTAGNAITFTQAMTLDASGNLGIGTTAPSYAVDVRNAASTALRVGSNSNAFGTLLSWDNTTGTGRLWTLGAYDLVFGNNGAEQMRLTSTGGNLGVGTSSPATKLEVSASGAIARISGTSGSVPQLQLSSGGVVNWSLRANNSGASDFTIFQDSTERARIDSSGNLLVGTTTAGGRLSVRTTGAQVDVSTSATNVTFEGIDRAATTNPVDMRFYARNGTFQWNNGSYTERMRLDASGNLIVGATSPAGSSQITAYGATNGQIAVQNSTNWSRLVQNAGDLYIDNGVGGAAGNTIFRNSSSTTERMRLDASGNLLLGAASRQTNESMRIGLNGVQNSLLVGNSSQNNGAFVGAFNDSAIIGVNRNPSTGVFVNTSNRAADIFLVGSSTDSYIGFGTATAANTATTERMRLDASGNLGLAVTPSAWGSEFAAMQYGFSGAVASYKAGTTAEFMHVISNAYNDNTNWRYIRDGAATRYEQNESVHRWYTSASGLTGNAITFTTAMTLDASSNLAVTGSVTAANHIGPGTGLTGTASALSIGGNAATATTATTANALNTANNYQVSSLGVGTAASGTAGEIRATNNITAYYSDDRLKTKLGKIENALDKLCSLDGFYYEANETAQSMGYEVKREVGVSAQQVQAIMPEIVAPAPIDENYLTVRYERALPLVIEAIKELRAELAEVKKSLGR